MPHVDEGLLHAYLDRELAGAERDQLVAHVAECGACRIRLDEQRALVARADELLGRAAPPIREPAAFPPRQRSRAPMWRVPAAWAATVTVAFAIGWYAQASRLAHEAAGRVLQPEASAPARNTIVPPTAVAKVKSSAGSPRADAAASPVAAQASSLRDELAPWPELDADGARALLGRAPAVLTGRAVRRIARSPTDAGLVLIEQEWRPGVVLRLYERRAIADELDAVRPSPERARFAPSAKMVRRGENLARYVNSLRVEISGPLAADSLAQLLDSVE